MNQFFEDICWWCYITGTINTNIKNTSYLCENCFFAERFKSNTNYFDKTINKNKEIKNKVCDKCYYLKKKLFIINCCDKLH